MKELIAEHRSSIFDTWLEQDKISCLPNYTLPAVISPTAFTSMVPKSLYNAEEDMNEYEFKVVWALSELGNVKWWHRNISRLGFQINGPVHAYPDIIVMLHSGKILMVETREITWIMMNPRRKPKSVTSGQSWPENSTSITWCLRPGSRIIREHIPWSGLWRL